MSDDDRRIKFSCHTVVLQTRSRRHDCSPIPLVSLAHRLNAYPANQICSAIRILLTRSVHQAIRRLERSFEDLFGSVQCRKELGTFLHLGFPLIGICIVTDKRTTKLRCQQAILGSLLYSTSPPDTGPSLRIHRIYCSHLEASPLIRDMEHGHRSPYRYRYPQLGIGASHRLAKCLATLWSILEPYSVHCGRDALANLTLTGRWPV
ncbi:hypothetical protein B0H15DRAFT_156768 [Mycena belliarum]|uniref:Uncharacterized protein n=1 Tax=Mycena belliarum TaxID=1033014 RepID=A0AAD6UCS5_9AGAR|nr:hypothetical protein B0H15DRAFT_156768 [Mycena belliae]